MSKRYGLREQRGGNATPLPINFYTPGKSCDFYRKQVSYNQCGHPMSQPDQSIVESDCGVDSMAQIGGSPLPMAYFNPLAETRPGYRYDSDCSLLTSNLTNQLGGGLRGCRDVYPLPGKILNLNRHLDTLGNNADVITLDNRRRMYHTYKKVYGLRGLNRNEVKSLFLNRASWSEFRNADYVVGQLLEIVHHRLLGKPLPVAAEGDQAGGNAFGAPFFIPNYGINPNLTSGQMDVESQVTNGYSYRFKGEPGFSSLWGSNLPTFNPV